MLSHTGAKSSNVFIILPTLLISLTTLSAIILTHIPSNALAVESAATATVNVASSCSLSGTISSAHNATIIPGNYVTNIGNTTLKAICNDSNGFDIYAIGFSGTVSDVHNEANIITGTNTSLVSDNGQTIATGLNNDTNPGDGSSNWAMKLSLTTPRNDYTPNILSDASGSYADYHVIPSTNTKVVSFNATTDTESTNLGSNVDSTYAVYLNETQAAGTYVGKVKYTLVHPNTSFSLSMQDFTTAMCDTLATSTEKYVTLYDRRDNNSYTVAYINGQCWMTQNLRIAGTVSANGSNFSGQNVNISVNDLTTGNSYTEPRTHTGVDDDNNPTTWYNYCAASAGTKCERPYSSSTAQDICPLGWHLPSGPNTTSGTDLNTLFGNTTSGWQDATASLLSFNAVGGGHYYQGSITNGDYDQGGWWSSTPSGDGGFYKLNYYRIINDDENQFEGDDDASSVRGYYVRCVMETRDISDITYMQEVSPSIVRNTAEGATATLTDRRDNKTYTVAKINGDLWMTQNLRTTGTISAMDSNFTGADFNISQYSLDSNDTSYTNHCDGINGFNYVCFKDSGNTTTGVWYNYAAATAGEIIGTTSATNATQDICPSGWRLPTDTKQQNVVGYESLFSPLINGYYANGVPIHTDTGYWLSSVLSDPDHMYSLGYYESTLNVYDYGYRPYGLYIRCMTD